MWGFYVTYSYYIMGTCYYLVFAAYFNFSEKQGPTPYFKPIHMFLRLIMVFVLISGFWIWIQTFGAEQRRWPYVTYFKNVMWCCCCGTNGSNNCQKEKGQPSHGMMWTTIVLIIITMVIGVILPQGPITKMFGL